MEHVIACAAMRQLQEGAQCLGCFHWVSPSVQQSPVCMVYGVTTVA